MSKKKEELVKGLGAAKAAAAKKKEQPPKEAKEPEIKEAKKEEESPDNVVLCKIEATLYESGKVSTNITGIFQNIVMARGLLAVLDHEIENVQSAQPGATRSPETKLLAHAVNTLNSISSVLINVQSVLVGMQKQIQAIPDAIFSGAGLTDEGSK